MILLLLFSASFVAELSLFCVIDGFYCPLCVFSDADDLIMFKVSLFSSCIFKGNDFSWSTVIYFAKTSLLSLLQLFLRGGSSSEQSEPGDLID